ncbi:MAG TPA: HAD family hydrolase [Patescibacteria group bacterium]|nr:HAD family hydrolase [Patescibacteria group bacterium]
MIKAIIFDWDDVFTLGSTQAYYACYYETAMRLGLSLSKEEANARIKSKWGGTIQQELGALIGEHTTLLPQAMKIYHEIIMGNMFVDFLTLVRGSDELLEWLSPQYELAIVSGIYPKLLVEKVFPKFKIKNVFSTITTVYDLGDLQHGKPHPYMVYKTLDALRVEAKDVILVGDAANDMKMAIAAGVTPIAVLTGHLNREEALALGVRYILDDVTKLRNLLLESPTFRS